MYEYLIGVYHIRSYVNKEIHRKNYTEEPQNMELKRRLRLKTT